MSTMKTLITLVLLGFSLNLAAQLSEGGMPYSFFQDRLKSQVSIPEHTLKKLDSSRLKQEDSGNPSPFRYSIFEDVTINIKDGVAWKTEDSKGTVWQYAIDSENAYSLQVVFKTFKVPAGAKLFLYNEDYSVIYGAFTKFNNEPDSIFTVADFPGQKMIIEYFEPLNAEFEGKVVIGQIGQAYRDILSFQEENALQDSFIDINCDQGKNYQNEKHAVCKITFRIGNSGYVCSGALINNTASDGTPYFLTANHCISDSATARTLVAYFNYENKWCGGPLNNYRTLAGSQLVTTGSRSDYTLLRLNNAPPVSYMPFYAGWDIGNYQDNMNISIHHPQGVEKKISLDYDKIITYDFTLSWNEGENSPPSTHWMVIFDEGVTREGSSGGPLFSKQKRIIGQLHGGSDREEFYGKLNYSWNISNPGYSPLKNYLDPGKTGATFVNSYFPPANPPDAFFTTSFANACLNYPVTLTDFSAFNPVSRTWIITPSTFTFVNGTNQTSSNPQVQFTAGGNYTVKLNVANSSGRDSLQVTNAITAGSTIKVDMISSLGNTLCFSDFDSLILTGYGAENYTWTLGQQAPNPFFLSRISGDTAILRTQPDIRIDSTYTLQVNTSGVMGTCTDTARQTIRFVQATNDNIANAIEISPGTSKTFSNLCATIQPGEPVPPADSCTGLKSWCDEYGTGQDIVENSVWFKFKGPATGKAGLRSQGFDNELAIYESNSYQDILNGIYTLLGANDDRTDTDPNPQIPEVKVQAGKTYWVQVDGSGGGTEGTFTLTLSDKNITSTNELPEDNSIVIYPQPVSGLLTIRGGHFRNNGVDLKVYSLSGRVLIQKDISKPGGNEIQINVGELSPGIYLLKITQKDKLTVKRFVKN